MSGQKNAAKNAAGALPGVEPLGGARAEKLSRAPLAVGRPPPVSTAGAEAVDSEAEAETEAEGEGDAEQEAENEGEAATAAAAAAAPDAEPR